MDAVIGSWAEVQSETVASMFSGPIQCTERPGVCAPSAARDRMGGRDQRPPRPAAPRGDRPARPSEARSRPARRRCRSTRAGVDGARQHLSRKLLAQRRLADPELDCGARQGPTINGGEEGAQVRKIDHRPAHLGAGRAIMRAAGSCIATRPRRAIRRCRDAPVPRLRSRGSEGSPCGPLPISWHCGCAAAGPAQSDGSGTHPSRWR